MNIVIIHTHDTGRYISPYGYPANTKNLQKISNMGFTYRNAFTVAPTCSPSRAALLTGLYPHQSGMFGLAHRGSKLRDYNLHLSNFLKLNNYKTALFGIQHEIDHDNISNLGYDHIEVDQKKQSSQISKSASKWINKYKSDKPFFISIGFFDTHREYPKEVSNQFDPRWQRPPEIFFDNQELRLDMAKFYTSLNKVDNGIGLIFKSLEEKSKLNETLILITTDHGIAWPGMKCNLNDHGTGIFLIAYMKKHLEGGIVNDDLVSNTDVFGTICKLCDLKKPNYLEDFILPNNSFNLNKRKFVFSEINIHASIEVSRSIRSKRFRFVDRISTRSRINLSNIDKSYAKTFLLKNGLKNKIKDQEEFYDIFNDPLERISISKNNFQKEYDEHKSILNDWRLKTNDPLLDDNFKWPSGIMLTDPDEENPAIVYGCTE
jgi:N-sulfoglucosamine sulfohydrolase